MVDAESWGRNSDILIRQNRFTGPPLAKEKSVSFRFREDERKGFWKKQDEAGQNHVELSMQQERSN